MKNYFIKQIYNSIFIPLVFVLFFWLIFLFDYLYDLNLVKFGVLPREIKGLIGIITSIFIHANLNHAASNTLPILILGMMLFYFYKKIAKSIFLWIWLISGIWLWIGGRNDPYQPNYHIGASTLIYGLASFLFFSGVFRKHLRLMVVSTLVVFLYGSIIWGIFPIQEEISWEGHLFGAIAGIIVAYNYRKEGPQIKKYNWDNEEDALETGEENNSQAEIPNQEEKTNEVVTIQYLFKQKKTNDNEDQTI